MHSKHISLAKVCHLWRAVLNSQPDFWTTVFINRLSPSIILLVELWLIRSGPTSPLSLTLKHDLETSTISLNVLTDQVLNLLSTQVHRWKSVELMLYRERPNAAMCSLRPGSAKILESIKLNIARWPLESQQKAWSALGSSPALRRVQMTSELAPLMPIMLPCGQLAHLQLPKGSSHEILFPILASCHSLEELTVKNPKGNAPAIPLPVVLPCLKTLNLFTKSLKVKFFDNLTAPALQKLDIICYDETRQKHISAFDGFLARSRCTVRSLSILMHQPPLPLLKSPYLVHLEEVCVSSAEKEILWGLAIDEQSGSPVLWPSVRRLELELDSPIGEDGLIASMLLSRAGTEYEIEWVKMDVENEEHGFKQDLRVVQGNPKWELNVVVG
ncbi:hypothetical protein AX16_009465 [Volvariella volvacea WC 439]|nr:hypothetical protein AX16_009465 [Volvariella volvacea WC 439]